MALRLKQGMELQLVITAGKDGQGFDVLTRSKVSFNGQALETETSRRHAPNEAAAWVLISQLAQDRLVGLADEAG